MRLITVAAVCLSIVGLAVATETEAAMVKMPTNIPAQGLGPALKELAKDRGFQVVFRSEVVGSARTQGASGNLTTPEALTELLKGTDLSYSYLDEKTVTIVPSAPTATSAAADQTQTTQNNSGGNGKNSSQDFRVARLDQTSAGPQTVESDQDTEKKKQEGLTEIVVTGTHIRGATTSLSPIMTFDRDAIDRSGYLDAQQFIQSIPQTFSGGARGASPDGMLGPGGNAGSNNEHASAANLRGLGENSTLTLLNGHRIAASSTGNVVDISTIPLSAIDHIDVLTDGASAIYGSDAVAGVVNIVLRSNFSGLETQATYGGASGGLRNEIVAETAGTEWSSGSIMASYQYQHQGSLPTSERSFTSAAPQPTNLINPYTENSLLVDGQQSLLEGLTVNSDVLATWKRTDAVISYGAPQSDSSNPSSLNAHLQLSYAIGDRWHADLNGTYARQETDVTFHSNPYGYPNGYPSVFYTGRLSEYELNIAGNPWSLPGGDLGVAAGATRRTESGEEKYADAAAFSSPPVVSAGRHITAEYLEIRLPFLGPENDVAGANRLVASAAVRHDAYSDVGGTTDPKAGLLWSPTSFLDVKANWSRAFRAPSIGELISNNFSGSTTGVVLPIFTNPSNPSGPPVPVLALSGNNPLLKPETATTYDAGFELRVPNIPNLKFSVDYYDVDFKNRIEVPTLDLNMLLRPNIYGSLITPFSSDAAAAAYVANNNIQLLDAGFGTSLAGVRYAYPFYLINAAVVHQNGVDLAGQYAFTVGGETFRTALNTAFINHIDTQFAAGTTPTNVANTYSNPLRLRMRWDGAWTHGPAILAVAVNYSNAYTNPFSSPPSSVGSFMTVDLTGSIQLAQGRPASCFHGMTLKAGATNLLDRAPPDAHGLSTLTGVNYDVGNANPLGRTLFVQLLKRW